LAGSNYLSRKEDRKQVDLNILDFHNSGASSNSTRYSIVPCFAAGAATGLLLRLTMVYTAITILFHGVTDERNNRNVMAAHS